MKDSREQHSNLLQNSCLWQIVDEIIWRIGRVLRYWRRYFVQSEFFAWLGRLEILRSLVGGCGQKLTEYWQQSWLRYLSVFAGSNLARWRSCCRSLGVSHRWRTVLNGLIITLAVVMPQLGLWTWLIPFLVIALLLNGPERWPQSRSFVIFGLLLLFAAIFSEAGLLASWPRLRQLEYWLLLAWLVGAVFTEQLPDKVIRYTAATSPVWMLNGFRQFLAGVPTAPGWLSPEQATVIPVRIHSGFGNPNYYAIYLLIITAFAAHLFQNATTRKLRYGWSAVLLLAVVSLYLTYSRAAWAIACLLLVVIFWPNRNYRWWLWLGFGVMVSFSLPDFQARIGSVVSFNDSSFAYRLQIWQGVLQAIPHYWLWGTGPGQFGAVYPWFQQPGIIAGHAHQLFLQMWLENGLLALIGFGMIIVRIFNGFRRSRGEYQVIYLLLLALLCYGWTESWDIHPFFGGYFWFLIGLTFIKPLPGKNMKNAAS